MMNESNFTSFKNELKKRQSKGEPWLKNLRAEAMQKAEQLGFPTLKDEEWKYTNLAGLLKKNFVFDDKKQKPKSLIKSANKMEFVFVNGQYSEDLSTVARGNSGVKVMTWSQLLENSDHEFNQQIPQTLQQLNQVIIPHVDKSIFPELNSALFKDGVVIYVDKDVHLPNPIYIKYYVKGAEGEEGCPSVYNKNLIVLSERSSACIIEKYVSGTEGLSFSCTATDIQLQKGAKLDFVKSQVLNEQTSQVSLTRSILSKDAEFNVFTLSMGSKLIRNNLSVCMGGASSKASVDGLYMTSGKGHIDNHTNIYHQKESTKSQQLYKGILNDQSRAVFNGRIYIEKQAQEVESSQLNKNLLLSDGAEIDTKPELEIYADNVKANHGAAIGQLDDEGLFYLMSRGISRDQAYLMLAKGFCKEAVFKIENSVARQEIEATVDNEINNYLKGII